MDRELGLYLFIRRMVVLLPHKNVSPETLMMVCQDVQAVLKMNGKMELEELLQYIYERILDERY